jgi:hypothetical protein
MTVQAEKIRSRRQHFAAPGGFHDRLVRFLAVALPAAIGVLAAVMVLTRFPRAARSASCSIATRFPSWKIVCVPPARCIAAWTTTGARSRSPPGPPSSIRRGFPWW